MAAAARVGGDSGGAAGRTGGTDPGGRADRVGQADDAHGAVSRGGRRPVTDRSGRGGAAGVGGDRRVVRVAVSSAGAAVLAEDRIRAVRDGRAGGGSGMGGKTLTIETPEGVSFSYALATPAARALAWSIDGSIQLAASILISKLTQAAGPAMADWAGAAGVLSYFA